jgi:uncharacterized membrane protein
MTALAALKVIHLLCAVLWVGGMFFAYVVLHPSMQAIDNQQRLLLTTQVLRRFFLVVWHAMPLIILTGLGMLWFMFGGMAAVQSGAMPMLPWPLHAMIGCGILMAVIFIALVFGPYRQFRRTIDRARMTQRLATVRRLIGINLLLGLIAVIAGGLL